MATKQFTDRWLRSWLANPPPARQEWHDSASELSARIGPNGISWLVIYRLDGQLRDWTFGSYPADSLEDARRLAGKAKRQAAKGRDPAKKAAKKAAKQAHARTVNHALDLFLVEKRRLWTPANYRNSVSRLQRVREAIGHRPIDQVSAAEIAELLADIPGDGAANRTHTDVASFFSQLVTQGRLSASPMAGMKRPRAAGYRDTFLAPEELGPFWRACEALDYPAGPFFQMLLATGGLRREDVSTMRWGDIHGDIWHATSSSGSTKLMHQLPLNSLTEHALARCPKFSGTYVFTTTQGQRPISGFTKYVDRLNAKLGLAARITPHTLRQTFATLAPEQIEVLPDEVSLVQGRATHRQRPEQPSAHSQFLRRKREVLRRWAWYVWGQIG